MLAQTCVGSISCVDTDCSCSYTFGASCNCSTHTHSSSCEWDGKGNCSALIDACKGEQCTVVGNDCIITIGGGGSNSGSCYVVYPTSTPVPCTCWCCRSGSCGLRNCSDCSPAVCNCDACTGSPPTPTPTVVRAVIQGRVSGGGTYWRNGSCSGCTGLCSVAPSMVVTCGGISAPMSCNGSGAMYNTGLIFNAGQYVTCNLTGLPSGYRCVTCSQSGTLVADNHWWFYIEPIPTSTPIPTPTLRPCPGSCLSVSSCLGGIGQCLFYVPYDCPSDTCCCIESSCICSDWGAGSCGGSCGGIECDSNERCSTRVCTPSGCLSEGRCDYDASCPLISQSPTNTPTPRPPTNTPPPGATNTPTPRPPTNTPTLRPTPTGTCAPNCSCASSTCVGSSCPDGCGGWCSGTLPQLAGTWSSWSSCIGCIQTRTCTLGQCGGACVGSSSRSCGLVDGGWSSWDDDCSTACGQTRYRTCTNPPPACGGADCVGSSSDVCSDADDGSPAITVISSPSGTQSNPTNLGQITVVPLNWNQNSSSLTDYYQVRVYDSSDNLDWSDNYVSGRSTTSVTTGSLALGEVYHWRVRAVNNDCGIDYGAWSSYGYFRLNTEPELDDFEVRNDDDDIVWADSVDPDDGDDRYQICDVEFIQGGSHSRQVRFVIEATDDDGVNEIEEISLRLDGAGSVTVSNLTTSPVSSFTGGGWSIYSAVEVSLVGGNLRVVFPMEFNEDFDNVNIYDVDVRVEDVYGDSSGWEDTGTNFMVWSCQVCDVGGNLYDASLTPFAWPVCPNEGYSILGEDMNLTSVVFEGAGVDDVDMEVISDNEYIRTGDCLIWGYVYTPELNSDLRGSIPVIRVTDTGAGVVGACDDDVDMTDSDGDVDPYSAVPSLQVDFSSVRDQDAWYQVVGCGGKAGQLLVDNVPNTCAVDVDCIESLSINSTRMANGLVVAPVVRNNSGCGDNCSFSDPNDWYAQIDTSVNLGTYQDLYSEYFVNLGLGVTYVSNTTMSDIESDVGGRGIVFVNGNLVVDVNNNIPVGEFLMVIVSGDISINESVSNTEGVFVSDGSVIAGGESDNQLTIEGVVMAGVDAIFTRSYVDHVNNNTSPAVIFSYRPDFIFTMPSELFGGLIEWRED
ncbi:thrombospondin type-1 domain-containing protein [Patescibacteria group bacterium]|nr:thrombospondin type-1 domain-containing protein [Patescibacteria group bacterium]